MFGFVPSGCQMCWGGGSSRRPRAPPAVGYAHIYAYVCAYDDDVGARCGGRRSGPEGLGDTEPRGSIDSGVSRSKGTAWIEERGGALGRRVSLACLEINRVESITVLAHQESATKNENTRTSFDTHGRVQPTQTPRQPQAKDAARPTTTWGRGGRLLRLHPLHRRLALAHLRGPVRAALLLLLRFMSIVLHAHTVHKQPEATADYLPLCHTYRRTLETYIPLAGLAAIPLVPLAPLALW